MSTFNMLIPRKPDYSLILGNVLTKGVAMRCPACACTQCSSCSCGACTSCTACSSCRCSPCGISLIKRID